MTSQKDIYRSAKIFMQQHGEDAERLALDKMNHFMALEDVVGASTWLMIAQAIQELEKTSSDATIH
ncbi:MAG: hypothetical protein V4735_08950 [Pseudomonadota bacterium]